MDSSDNLLRYGKVEQADRSDNGVAAITKLTVQLDDSKSGEFLSSQIYSFVAARTSGSPRHRQARAAVVQPSRNPTDDESGAAAEDGSTPSKSAEVVNGVVAGDVMQALKDLMHHAQVACEQCCVAV